MSIDILLILAFIGEGGVEGDRGGLEMKENGDMTNLKR